MSYGKVWGIWRFVFGFKWCWTGWYITNQDGQNNYLPVAVKVILEDKCVLVGFVLGFLVIWLGFNYTKDT